MGGTQSNEDDEDANVPPPPKDVVFDFQDIYYDQQGNLRMGKKYTKTKKEKDRELREVLSLEEDEEDYENEDNRLWYIMDASWINDWFAYVHNESDTAPNPGPCRNDRLLRPDYETGKWVAYYRMIMASKTRAGDYRRVTRRMWELYCRLYPGSGPAITTLFKKDDDLAESGLYDTSGWEVDSEFPLPPDPSGAVHARSGPGGEITNVMHWDQEELMEDKKITKNLKAQLDFLQTRKLMEEDERKKKRKPKKRSSRAY